MSIATTEAVGLDGRPLIEVTAFNLSGQSLHIEGTAVVYEGNVMVRVVDRDGRTNISNVQASAGGPQRGVWSTDVAVSHSALRVIVGQEEMEEAAASRSSREVIIPVHDGEGLHQGSPEQPAG